MNQRAMYGSTAACSVNVPSTSNLPQQHSGGVQPTPTMYYVSQLPAETYGQQQIFPYAGDSFAQQQQDGAPIKDVYSSTATNQINRHIYSYNLLPTNQTDFTSNIHPHQLFSTQPPSLTNQNQSTAAPQILSQPPHHQINHNQVPQQHQFNAHQQRSNLISAQNSLNQPQIHSSQHPAVNHQLPNLMHPPPYAQKRDNSQQQTYPLNLFHNNSSTYSTMPPNKMQNIHQGIHSNNGNGHNNGQDQRTGRLSTMFDTTTDNYTASWVSSTSSIPPDQKLPPDNNSRHNSPTSTFEFNNWANEQPKMSSDSQQAQSSNLGQSSNISPNVQSAPPQNVYAGQPQQFHIPTTTAAHSIQPVPFYQNQFAPHNFGFYQVPPQQQYMGYPQYFMPGPVQGGLPNFVQGYAHQPYIPPAMAFNLVPPFNPLFPLEARPLGNDQNERFDGTWLDQNKHTQQELDIQKETIPIAIEHNNRQMTGAHSGHRSGLLGSVSQSQQQMNGNNGNRPYNRKPRPSYQPQS